MSGHIGTTRVNIVIFPERMSAESVAELHDQLTRAKNDLNRVQSGFWFELYSADPLKGSKGRKDGHSLDEYYASLEQFAVDVRKKVRPGYPHNCFVGVCNSNLQDKFFNDHRGDYAVITMFGSQSYRPSWTSDEQYLTYLLLCSAILMACPGFEEHLDSHGCLFDACDTAMELKAGLRRPLIHAGCKQTLAQEFTATDDQLDEFDMVLRGVKRRDLMLLVASEHGSPTRSLMVGVGIAFVANVVTFENSRFGVALSFVVICALAFWWVGHKSLRMFRTPSSRRWAFRALVLSFAVGLGGGLYGIAVKKIPPLPSEEEGRLPPAPPTSVGAPGTR